jgi:transcription initiation factor TFIIIB Brf1 subunit/transcription initiation factor TFIIB
MRHHFDHAGRRCADCGSEDLVEDWTEGDLTCRECGLVAMGCMIDGGAEWMSNAEEGLDRSRVGAPSNPLFDSTITSTAIPKYGSTWKMSRINDHMSLSYKHRTLYKAYVFIQEVCERPPLSLPGALVEIAKELYKHIKESKITRGENHRALLACCVYYACKVNTKMGIKLEKTAVADAFGVDRGAFTSACKTFLELVQDQPYYEQLFDDNANGDRGLIMKTLLPFDLDAPVASATAWNKPSARWKLARKVEDLYHQVRGNSDGVLDAKTPHSIITALIAVASEELEIPLTKNDIKKHCKVSAVTLNKTIGLVKEVLGAKSNE